MKLLQGTDVPQVSDLPTAGRQECLPHTDNICRRAFLGRSAAGIGLAALNSLLGSRALGAGTQGLVNPLHHPAKAKRVIFLYQAGGPSHLETFDNKPKLAAMHGEPMP